MEKSFHLMKENSARNFVGQTNARNPGAEHCVFFPVSIDISQKVAKDDEFVRNECKGMM